MNKIVASSMALSSTTAIQGVTEVPELNLLDQSVGMGFCQAFEGYDFFNLK